MTASFRKPIFSDLDDSSILRAYTKPKGEGVVREIMPTSYRRVTTAKTDKVIVPTTYRKVK